MIKAVIQGGQILLQEPLPEDWRDGVNVFIEKSDEGEPHAADVWMDEVERVASQGTVEDDQRLDDAIQEIRRREKELARQKLGLVP